MTREELVKSCRDFYLKKNPNTIYPEKLSPDSLIGYVAGYGDAEAKMDTEMMKFAEWLDRNTCRPLEDYWIIDGKKGWYSTRQVLDLYKISNLK